MLWLKKASGILIIFQLLLGAGGTFVAESVNDTSQESLYTKDLNTETSDSEETTPSEGISVEEGRSNMETSSTSNSEAPIKKQNVKASDEKIEETSTEETTREISEQSVQMQASGSGTSETDPRVVSNSSELRAAIEVDKVAFVQLEASDSVFQFDQAGSRIAISNNVTIDGNGRTASYKDNTRNFAFEIAAANLHVKIKNISFGSSDFTIPAYDYYGFCRGNGHANTTIEVENINYYSTAAAQPFHNRGTDSKIVFSGENYFTVQKGSYSQEFAECNNFVFEKNSHTIIGHNTGQANSIATSGSDFNFELKDGAIVDYSTTSSRFVDNFTGRGNVVVGNNAELKLNGNGSFSSVSESVDFDVMENGSLDVAFANKLDFKNDSTFHLANDSTLDMSVTSANQIFNTLIPASNFIIDNAYRLSFNVSSSGSKEPVNSGFTFNEFRGGITGYGLTANNSPINTTVATKDTITSNGTNFTLSNATSRNDFTVDEKTTIRGAKRLVFQRLPNPTVISNVHKEVADDNASFNLTDYLTNGNEISKIVYKLYDSQQDPENFGTEISTQELTSSITDSVKFNTLSPEKDYWVYVQIVAKYGTGDSQWFEVPFTTKSDILSVTIPTSMFFNTDMDDSGKLTIHSPSYMVTNSSAYPIEVAMNSFSEEGDSGIELLDSPDSNNNKGLFLQLNKNNQVVTTLKTDISNLPMGEVPVDDESSIRLTGEYFGPAGKAIDVNYKMTLDFKKAGT